jgi:preprotein translocase subunit YajC
MKFWEIFIQVALVGGVLLTGFILLVRPQLRRSAQHKRLLASLAVGDKVVTRGGFIAEVVSLDTPEIVSLMLSNSMIVQIERRGIERKARR